MKVLVTGGAGFIGSHIVDKLIERRYEVVIIDNLSTGKKENLHPLAKFYNKDICDQDIDELLNFEQPDYVVHHAAQISVQTSLQNPVNDADVNIIGSLNLIKHCAACNVKKIIYASSAAVTVYY